jgi:hypothetical protein
MPLNKMSGTFVGFKFPLLLALQQQHRHCLLTMHAVPYRGKRSEQQIQVLFDVYAVTMGKQYRRLVSQRIHLQGEAVTLPRTILKAGNYLPT